MYADCPITWSSKLLTEINFFNANTKYIVQNQSLREVMSTTHFLDKLKPGEDLHVLKQGVYII